MVHCIYLHLTSFTLSPLFHPKWSVLRNITPALSEIRRISSSLVSRPAPSLLPILVPDVLAGLAPLPPLYAFSFTVIFLSHNPPCHFFKRSYSACALSFASLSTQLHRHTFLQVIHLFQLIYCHRLLALSCSNCTHLQPQLLPSYTKHDAFLGGVLVDIQHTCPSHLRLLLICVILCLFSGAALYWPTSYQC